MWQPMGDDELRHLIRSVTGGFADPERLERLKHGFWVPRGTSFRISSNQRTLGSIHVVDSEQTAFRVRGRDARTAGTVLIGFLTTGWCDIERSSGGTHRVVPGGALVVPDWARYNLTTTAPTRGLSILMPQERLVARGVKLVNAFRGDSAFSLTNPLRHFASAIAETAWRPSRVAELIAERTVEDLLVGVFLESSGLAMDGEDLRAGLRARATLLIRERHRDPEFSPPVLAQQLGVSLRHLQRAFHGSAQPVATSIARYRSESAELLLASPGGSSLTLSEVAARVGFTSVFELRSAFRQRFGELPSAHRRRVLDRPAEATETTEIDIEETPAASAAAIAAPSSAAEATGPVSATAALQGSGTPPPEAL